MRICIVNEFFYPDSTGGTGAVLSGLARGLKDTHPDLEIDVITSRHLYRNNSRPLDSHEIWDGIHIFRLATPQASKTSIVQRLGANILFSGAALWRLLRTRGYDLILVGTAPPTLAAAASLLKQIKGTPYAYVIYDIEPDRAVTMKILGEHSRPTLMLRNHQRRWLHAASRVVVLGRCMRDHLIASYGMRADDIAVIQIGADPDEVRPLDRKTRFRARHGLNGFVALYSGNFGRYHDFDTILDAARELQPLRDDITFVLVGEGAQREHIARRIAAENLCNVRLFPFVPQEDYADLLASADVSFVTLEAGMEGICVPSKFYSILASGRPTVAMTSPASEVAMVIAEARCGIRLDQGDSAGLVSTLKQMADSPAEMDRMGQAARRELLDHYSAQQTVDAYHQVFLKATHRTAGEETPVSTPAAEAGAPH